MGPTNDNGQLGGMCGYAKSKYEKRVDERRKRRSLSAPTNIQTQDEGRLRKLHKPPQVQAVSERPRNRLRKTLTSPLPLREPVAEVFVLEHAPYSDGDEIGKVLGVYSTFDLVTHGALKHGAYAFSRDGLLDGSEYLSTSGRIKIARTSIQQNGVKATLPEHSKIMAKEHIRLDIPHPESSSDPPKREDDRKHTVFVAIRKGPHKTSWIGVFAEKSLAWGSCLKDKAMCATTYALHEEVRSIGLENMPQVTGRLVGPDGSARHTWMVQAHAIDSTMR